MAQRRSLEPVFEEFIESEGDTPESQHEGRKMLNEENIVTHTEGSKEVINFSNQTMKKNTKEEPLAQT